MHLPTAPVCSSCHVLAVVWPLTDSKAALSHHHLRLKKLTVVEIFSEQRTYVESHRNLMAPMCAGSLVTACNTTGVSVIAGVGGGNQKAYNRIVSFRKTEVCVATAVRNLYSIICLLACTSTHRRPLHVLAFGYLLVSYLRQCNSIAQAFCET
jgi:hypothetical protein